MKKVLFFCVMFVCATTFTSCSEDFWSGFADGFEAGYNAYMAPARVDTPTDAPSENDTNGEKI
ncbi:MAG: hypothetical protein J6A35_02450 [Paludibacteraceae bacterium]|nr:hypothetical protein [Paludibacteraceae bacterium]